MAKLVDRAGLRNRLATSLGRVSKPRERRAALARPRAGFEQMYSIMENALVAEGVDVRTGATVRGIEVDGGGLLVSTDRGAERFDVVVSTIDRKSVVSGKGVSVR